MSEKPKINVLSKLPLDGRILKIEKIINSSGKTVVAILYSWIEDDKIRQAWFSQETGELIQEFRE